MNFPILKSESSLTLNALWKEKFHQIETDWFQNSTPYKPSFLLASDPENFYFLAEVSGDQINLNPETKAGTFTEDLWKFDVAEIFFGEKGSDLYQEFNLAPTGAWFSFLFRGERERLKSLESVSEISAYAECLSNTKWRGSLSIPREHVMLNHNNLTANVTFNLGDEVRYYYSFAQLNSEKPNFHLYQEFMQIHQE
ncbi:MAG: hypothetical protein H6619_03220 [Deltaproteobacteria bacterium]|nr:hypothetical protein [Deltaproteobacteria bacterium]